MKRTVLITAVISIVMAALPKASATITPGIYWRTDAAKYGGSAKVQRANLDGTGVEDIITGVGPGSGIALDSDSSNIYWADGGIKRANIDGTSIEDLITNGTTAGFDLDLVNGKIYWETYGAIKRANLDGSDVETVVDTYLDSVSASACRDIALDTVSGKMYWTNVFGGGVGTRRILRADLDGTNIEIIASGLGTPDGIALDIANNMVYWTDENTSKIQRTNMDGGTIEDLVNLGSGKPYGLALNLLDGKMYFSDYSAGTIYMSNLDGTGVEDFLTGLERPLHIAYVPEPATMFLLGLGGLVLRRRK